MIRIEIPRKLAEFLILLVEENIEENMRLYKIRTSVAKSNMPIKPITDRLRLLRRAYEILLDAMRNAVDISENT